MNGTRGRRWVIIAGPICAAVYVFCCRADAAGMHTSFPKTLGGNWPSYGRSYSETRYSPLSSINAGNISSLGLIWFLDLPGQHTLEGTPLAVDGVLYFSGTYGTVFAVDGRTGKKLWEFSPDLAGHNPQKLRLNMGANRGVAYWNHKIFAATNDGRLIALSASNGRFIWSVKTVEGLTTPKFVSGAPRAFEGKVVIGHGSSEAGSRGYVSAYDAETGVMLWRFYTVPGSPGNDRNTETMEADTWSGSRRQWGGGAVWDSIVYDPELNNVYLATGNGNPVNAEVRSPGGGDNLFLCSIIAVDADTGKYVWHYQINPRDSWDYDSTQQMILADLRIGKNRRRVLMQAPKNGFFYVIDRVTGELISSNKFAKATWADRIDLQTGRPVETANVHYTTGPITIWPSATGAHNWQPMSFSQDTRLVYIPTMQASMRVGPVGSLHGRSGDAPSDTVGVAPLYSMKIGADVVYENSDPNDGRGGLLAWDPVAQRKQWEIHYSTFWNGGVLSSAGDLVFQGTGAGEFIAYDARTGHMLWSFDAGLGIVGAPITFEAGGLQYISILVGYGGLAGSGTKLYDAGWRFGEQPRRLLTFALHGRGTLPPGHPPRFTLNAVDDNKLIIDQRQAALGAQIYGLNYCGSCHGSGLESTGSIAPDLRESVLAINWEAFRSVLHDGTLVAAGMPKFDDLSEENLRGIYMYIRQQARRATGPGRR